MAVSTPHYQLYAESLPVSASGGRRLPGWKFVLRSDGGEALEASDHEPGVFGERLELLALVRGLEAIDHPANVTVVTSSRYVRLGLAHGLEEWRASGWCWEFFGQMVPVKNGDLWRRVDRALKFHTVECRAWRADPAHVLPSRQRANRPRRTVRLRERLQRFWGAFRPARPLAAAT